MPLVVNTNIVNNLTGYLADAKNIKNTLIIVQTLEERDEIPLEVLEGGYFVYVNETEKYYHYITETETWDSNLPGLQNAITDEDKLNAKFVEFTDLGTEPITLEEKAKLVDGRLDNAESKEAELEEDIQEINDWAENLSVDGGEIK